MLPGPAAKHRPRFPRNRVSQTQVSIVILLFVSTIGGLATFLTRRCEHCTTAPCKGLHHLPVAAQDGTSRRRRLAVVIPYRDRLDHLRTMLPITRACLRRSNAGAWLSDASLAKCVGLVKSSTRRSGFAAWLVCDNLLKVYIAIRSETRRKRHITRFD